MVKTCCKCKVEKDVVEFSKDKNKKDGYQTQCKSCHKAWREANKDKINAHNRAYHQANKDKINAQQKAWYEANKDKRKAQQKAYNEANKDKKRSYDKAYREANKDKINAYQKQRKKTDPLFKLKKNLRCRTYQAFKNRGYSKNTKTQQMLGVDWEVAKKHIERQFKKGMNWNNYGEWHIDHIIPLASANTEERLKRLCHYTNLQPLWAEHNLIKKDKINGQQTLLRI